MNCKDVTELSSLYVSHGLDSRQSADFEAHLGVCPACARAVDLDAALRKTVLEESLDPAGIDREVRRRIGGAVRMRRVLATAAIAALLILGVLVYRRAGAANPVYVAAALDHRQEVVYRERRNWATDAGAVAALGRRRGIAVPALDALVPAGYRFEHAKLCRLNGLIYLHLVYSEGSREISVFLRPPDSAGRAEVRIAQVGGECVAAFDNAHVSAIVVTEQSRAKAAEVARYASSVL